MRFNSAFRFRSITYSIVIRRFLFGVALLTGLGFLQASPALAGSPPTVSSLSPNSGSMAGGDSVTVTGTNFVSGATTTIGGNAATTNFVNSTTLTVTTPAVSSVGAVIVTVTNPDTQSGSLSSGFTYTTPTPTITSVSPSSGPTAGATDVTISGTNFIPANTTNNSWSTSGNTLATATYGNTTAVVGNYVYLYGGSGTTTSIYRALVSSPTSFTLVSGKTLPAASVGSSLAIVGSTMYLYGAYSSNVIMTASTSDPTTWTTSSKTLPGNLSYSSLAIVGSTMYLFGGSTANCGAATNVIYSASTSDPTTWTNTGSTIPASLCGMTLVRNSTNLYLLGGLNGSTAVNTIYTASLSTPTSWSNTGKTLPSINAVASTITIGNNIYLFGGATSSSSSSVNTIYSALLTDPTTWTNTGKTLPVAIATNQNEVAMIGNTVYMYGGFTTAASNAIYTLPITGNRPNFYNPSWITNAQTLASDQTTVTLGGTAITNLNVVSATQATGTTAAHSAGSVTATMTNYDGTSGSLSSAYTYGPPTVSNVTPNSGPTSGNTPTTITGTNFQASAPSTVSSFTTASGTIPAATQLATSTVVGSNVYMYGGTANSTAIYRASTASPTTWTTVAGKTLPSANIGGTLAIVGSTMYLYGSDAAKTIMTASTSDPTTWTLSSKTLPANLSRSNLEIIGSTMYLFGGSTGTNPVCGPAVNVIYSASTSDPTTWTNTGSTLPVTLCGASILRTPSSMYLIGGYTGSFSSAIYTASLSAPTTWTNTGKTIPVAQSFSTLITAGTSDYLIGGFTGSALNTVYSAPVNDPTTWTNTGSTLPGNLDASSLAIINNTAYLLGGYNGSATNVIYSASVTRTLGTDYNPNWQSPYVSTTTLTFGGTAATNVQYLSPTQLTAVTPAHAAGAVDVVATNTDSQTGTFTSGYTYVAPPTVASVNPNQGSVNGSVSVTITGTGFTSGASVSFGGTAATNVTVVSSTSITATTPAHASGAVNLVVTNADSQTGTLTNGYTYNPVPTVASISPNNGPPAGGTVVTITGTNFITSPLPTVTIGGTAATGITGVTATSITATVPAKTAGSYDVVVINNDGQTATLTNGYTYNPVPTVSSITPNNGPTSGSTSITITGTGFMASPTVQFGTTAATNVTRVNSTTITATTPAHAAGAVNVVVTDTDTQTATLTSGYTFNPPPTVSSMTPTSGSVNGSTNVTITGTNFLSGATVKFSSSSATSVTVVNSTTITATTPAHAAGAVNVVVTDTDTQTATLTSGYTFNAIPTVVSINPNNGTPAGGTNVTITGTNFIGSPLPTVTIGGIAATNVVVVSATSITATTPAQSVGSYDVVVLDSDSQSATLTSGYTYNPAPTVSSIAPTNGPMSGNTSVTITGTNFLSNPSVTFGGTAATNVTRVNATTITATTPAHAAGAVDLIVTNADTQSATLAGGYTFNPPPTFTSIAPVSGTVSGGDTVTITGTNFLSNPSVTFGGTAATNVTRVNATTITATTPAHAAGAATVTVTDTDGQSASLTNGFAYQAPPASISSLSPTVGVMAGGTTVVFSGTGFTSGMTATFNGVAATTVGNTATSLTVTTPAGTPGDATIVVGGTYIASTTLSNAYRYVPDAYAFITAPLNVHATQPGMVTIEARDANGNAVTAPYDITLSLATTANSGSFSANGTSNWGISTIIIPAGQSRISFYYRDGAKGTPTLTVTGPANVSISQQETILSQYLLLVTGVSNPINAGVPSSVSVQAVDWQGVANNDYVGTIHFTSSDGYATLPSDFTITAAMRGHHTFVNGVTMITTGQQTVTATDTSDSTIVGTQSNITVNNGYNGTAAALAIITDPPTAETNAATSAITVEAQDASGNPAPLPVDVTIYVASPSATGQFSLDGVSGWSSSNSFTAIIKAHTASVTVYYRDSAVGNYNLTFKDQSGATDTGLTDTSQVASIGVGPPVALNLNTTASDFDGVWNLVTVTLQDSQGRTANAPTDPIPVYLTSDDTTDLKFSSDPSGSNPSSSLVGTIPVGGNHITAYVESDTNTTANVTVSDATPPDGNTGLSDMTLPISFVATNPDHFVLTPGSSTVTAGQSTSLHVVAENAAGQAAAQPSSTTVTLSSTSGGSFSLLASPWNPITSVTLPAIHASFDVYYKSTVAGTATPAVSASFGQGSTNITVTPAAYSTLGFSSGSASAAVGSPNVYSVTSYDAFGNVVVQSSDTPIYLYTSDGTGSFATSSNGPWTATSAIITNGSSTATFYYEDTALNATPTLTASDQTPLDNPDTGIANATIHLTIGGDATAAIKYTAGQTQTAAPNASTFGITVTASQTSGAPAKQGSDLTINLQTTSGGTGTFTASSDVNGTAITSVIIPAGSSSVTFYYHDTKVGVYNLTATAPTLSLTTPSPAQITVQANAIPPPSGPVTSSSPTLVFATAAQTHVLANTPSNQIEIDTADQYGNVVPVTTNTTINLANGSACGGSYSVNNASWTPISQITIAAGNSSAFFYYQAPQDCSMAVSATGFQTGTQSFEVYDEGAKLGISGPSTIELNQTASYVVTLEDTSGNPVTASHVRRVYLGSGGDVTVNTAYVDIAIGSSSATFTALASNTTTGSGTITVRDEANANDPDTGLQNGSQAITVVNGAPASLNITTNGDATANVSKQLTVHLLNADGVVVPATADTTINLATSTNDGTSKFTATSDVSGAAITSVLIPNGSTNATVYYHQLKTGTVQLTDTATSLTGGSLSLLVTSNTIVSYQFISAPNSAQAGQPLTYVFQALDAFGNVVTLMPGQHFYISSTNNAGILSAYNYNSSDHSFTVDSYKTATSFTYQANTPTTDTLTLSDVYPVDNPDTGITNATASVTVVQGPAKKIVFLTGTQSLQRGQVSDPMIVEIQNQYGIETPVSSDTVITLGKGDLLGQYASSTGEFALSTGGPWSTSSSLTILNGDSRGTFYYRDDDSVSINQPPFVVKASSPGLSTDLDNVNVGFGPATSFAFVNTTAQTLVATHTSDPYQLVALNQYGFEAQMPQNETVHLQTTAPNGEFATSPPVWQIGSLSWAAPTNATAINKSPLFYYRGFDVGTDTITATITGYGNASQTVTITPQYFDHFLVTNISDPQVVGTPTSVVVIAQDSDDYTVAAYNGTIHFSADDPTATIPSDYTYDPAADHGLHTFTNGVLFQDTGVKNVTVTDLATGKMGTQQNIHVLGDSTVLPPTNSVNPTNPTQPTTTTPPTSTAPPVNMVPPATVMPITDGTGGGGTNSGNKTESSDLRSSTASKASGGLSGTISHLFHNIGSFSGAVARGIGHAITAIGHGIKRVIGNKLTPIVVPAILYLGVFFLAGLLLRDMYREIRYAHLIGAILKREAQTAADKSSFMNLAAHHIRTPVTIIGGAVELFTALAAANVGATKLTAIANSLKDTANKIVEDVTARAEKDSDGTLPEPTAGQNRLYASPLFWAPLAISIGLTVLINILGNAIGHDGTSSVVYAAQVLVAALAAAVLYSTLRGRSLRKRYRTALDAAILRRKDLDTAKNQYIETVAAKLSLTCAELKGVEQEYIGTVPQAALKPLLTGTKQLQKLIDTMLMLSTIDTTTIVDKEFVPQELLKTSQADLRDQIARKQVTVEAVGDTGTVVQDERLLRRVTTSLLDNAVDYSPDGSKVFIETKLTDKASTITFKDNGPGLPKAVTDNMLAPFTHPEDTLSASHQGIGLSLYLDMLILRHLGGELEAHNTHDGPIVSFTIPRNGLALPKQ